METAREGERPSKQKLEEEDAGETRINALTSDGMPGISSSSFFASCGWKHRGGAVDRLPFFQPLINSSSSTFQIFPRSKKGEKGLKFIEASVRPHKQGEACGLWMDMESLNLPSRHIDFAESRTRHKRHIGSRRSSPPPLLLTENAGQSSRIDRARDTTVGGRKGEKEKKASPSPHPLTMGIFLSLVRDRIGMECSLDPPTTMES